LVEKSAVKNQRHIDSARYQLATIAFLVIMPSVVEAQRDGNVDYARDVRPLLSRHCYVCHGPDPGSRVSGLRLDRADSALAVLESGVAPVIPGSPDDSELIRRLTSQDADERMPPVTSGHALSGQEIEILRRWISFGAKFDDHWSFRPIELVHLPNVRDVTWTRNPIDRFVLAVLEKRRIAVSAEASRATLIRRLSLDLLGLPPTPEDAERYLKDERSDAYERLVDRLLASPRFGERWGRHWLDLAHYADSDGYLSDALRPSAWLYRDWVIEAFNSDMPFDQFTIEQLAGDLLPDATFSQKTATGFLRNTLRNNEAGVDLEEYRLKEVVDRVSTIGAGWLGLTVGCAECHSHKYDPISQREFYELFSFLNDADDIDIPVKLADEQVRYQREKVEWEGKDQNVREVVNQVILADDENASFDFGAWYSAIAVESKKRSKEQNEILKDAKKQATESLRSALEDYEQHYAKRPKAPSTKILTVGSRTASRETYVHIRGDYRNRGDAVAPGTPAVLPPLQTRSEQADRLDFARWLVDPNNPLTARVTVNQFWAHLFGRGLVASVDNFGVGGDLPSHPELLDWLAHEFVSRGWSRKDLLRLIVCSSTYRQSASPREDLLDKDPSNESLARQARFRLEAESIRDTALFSAGLLESRIGGPGIRPPQPDYVTSISRNAEWKVTSGGDQYRRGMYIVLRRATPYPMLLTFDAPDSTIACTRRERSNSPLQALTLLNDPVYFECAQALGHCLANRSAASRRQRLEDAFHRCLGREAKPEELDRILQEFNEHYSRLKSNLTAAKAIVMHPAHSQSELPWRTNSTDLVEEATWVVIARILMNVDEFITRE
jgi:Protein of unknown function (DUF1553)/Protein of unknown function (DUF1549)/Planctomycete cytochrome C